MIHLYTWRCVADDAETGWELEQGLEASGQTDEAVTPLDDEFVDCDYEVVQYPFPYDEHEEVC